ncbi:MAG: sulfatase [Thermoanaerobaculia bacterium]|nr:sulfatase [Thermoanaerobaculia bacterium]
MGHGREIRARREPSRLDRHSLWVAALAAGGALGLFQTALLMARVPSLRGGLEPLPGLASLGLPVGVLTVLLLTPVGWAVRRFRVRRGADPLTAAWSGCLGAAAAVAAWTLADLGVTSLSLRSAGAGLLTALLALAAGAAAGAWVRPSRAWIAIGAVATAMGLLAAGTIALGRGRDAAPQTPALSHEWPPRHPDVVLVTVDTLRADRVGLYGAAPSRTPEIDRLGQAGVVFRRALASSPWTIPSLATVMTGLPTVRHRAGWPMAPGPTFWRSALNEQFFTLAERFAAAGYRTNAVVANGFLSRWTGIDQGFASYANPFLSAMATGTLRDLPLTRLLVALAPPESWGDFRASGVTDAGLDALAADVEAPLFLWLHYIDPHSPFQADPGHLDPRAAVAMIRQEMPATGEDGTVVGDFFAATERVRSGTLWLGPADRRRLVEIYDGEVAYTDREIGRLFAALEERATARPVVAALTADHGEEFWDHGGFEHGHDYYREVTGIPLLFWGPGRVPAGGVFEHQVGLVDVAPTLLELAGLEPPAPSAPDEGRSLVPLWSGAEAAAGWRELPRFASGNLYDLPAALVEEGRWRYLLRANGAEELYDLDDDPGERFNRARDLPEIAARYRELLAPRLDAVMAGLPGEDAPALTSDELRALRALGYLD